MTKANIMPWYFPVSAMVRGGAIFAPIVPCRLSRHIGGFGNARAFDTSRPQFFRVIVAVSAREQIAVVRASFDASGSDFCFYPERRHLLAVQYLAKWGREQPTFASVLE